MVRLQSLQQDQYTFNEKEFAVIGRRSGMRYVFGQSVKVKVKSASKERRQIDFYMVEE